jgi:hypothetical protein
MNDRLRRWVGLEGLALIVVLLITVFFTPNTPDPTASPAKVAMFVNQHRGGLYLSAYLTSLAVLIAASFLWYLRDVVAPAMPGRRLANLGFVGGILFLVGGVYSAGVAFAMADVGKSVDPIVLQTLNIFVDDVNNFAGASIALLIGATSLAILKSKALPSWLAYLGLVFGVASFALPLPGFFAVGLWLLITSLVVLVASRRSGTSTEPTLGAYVGAPA